MKKFLANFLLPLAYLYTLIGPSWQRMWAFACLRTALTNVDSSVVILGVPELHGTKNIHLGRNLYLYRDLYLETQDQGEIIIGDDVVISSGVHIVSFERIRIGKGSMIGEYVSIRDANHLYGPDVLVRDSGHTSNPIEIGSNVWIGRGVTILAGVKIGDGAVIGANAVVTKNIPSGMLAVGIPARALIK